MLLYYYRPHGNSSGVVIPAERVRFSARIRRRLAFTVER
jgi:hypothetical protein